MISLIKYLHKQPKHLLMLFSIMLAILLGLLDYQTGIEYSFSLLYLLPISLAVWYVGERAGVFISLISAVDWLLAAGLGREDSSNTLSLYWNDLSELTIFLVVTFTLSALKSELNRQQTLALTDPLTGIANKRAFIEESRIELERAKRYQHSFTLVYIDLDNFKSVNDKFGHSTGDELLRSVAETARHSIRAIDIVARLGGDEFALVLPEIDAKSAQLVLQKLQAELLKTMQKKSWPVTFSIGAITLLDAVSNLDEIIEQADSLMYQVKKTGKNLIRHSVLTGSGLELAS